SKEDTTHSRRIVFKTLQDKDAVTELFQNVSQKVGDRPGGYTRIVRTGHRLGDNASMCFIELVDYNENMLQDTSAPKKTRRRRTRRKSTSPAASTPETVQAEKSENIEATSAKEVAKDEPKTDKE
ncbi:MAG TPA: bL17 family ribosomal protein, partial [Dysgonamonadaceae bacterium]|nr:bL17 family ribosomal protein [Dysgonamonadaceae bacterium]